MLSELEWDVKGGFWYHANGLNVGPSWMLNHAIELEAENAMLDDWRKAVSANATEEQRRRWKAEDENVKLREALEECNKYTAVLSLNRGMLKAENENLRRRLSDIQCAECEETMLDCECDEALNG